MDIWLKTWASDEYDSVCFAVVDVTPEKARRWLARMDIVSELKRFLGDVHCVEFENEPIVFHTHIEELDDLIDDLRAEEIIVVQRPICLPVCSIVPHEITRLAITPDEIYWRCHREGASTIMITVIIPRMLVENLARESYHARQF